jgi:hypothetical protein
LSTAILALSPKEPAAGATRSSANIPTQTHNSTKITILFIPLSSYVFFVALQVFDPLHKPTQQRQGVS